MGDFLDTDYYEKESIFLDVEITAYVEDIEDEIFWADVFAKYAPSLKIIFYPHSRDNKFKSGVQEVLKEKDKTGKNLILCIDSDFRYLLQDKEINDNPFIFQTYTYSIENHKCAPQNLNRIIKTATLMQGDFDFVKFLETYSQTIYPLFLYILYFEKKKHEKIQNKEWINDDEFTINEKRLKEVLGIPSNEVTIENNAQLLIENLEKRVAAFENEINLKNIEDYLKDNFQIEKSDIFWYINGHIIYNNVVELLLRKIISSYKRQQRQKYEFIDQTEIVKTKHRQYKNYIQEIKWETLLATNHLQCLAFDNVCPLMEKIKDDIVVFCKDRKPTP
jgi:hypothetical protein